MFMGGRGDVFFFFFPRTRDSRDTEQMNRVAWGEAASYLSRKSTGCFAFDLLLHALCDILHGRKL